MEILNLVDRPQFISEIAQWYYNQWGGLENSESVQSIEIKLQDSLHEKRPPLAVIAVDGESLIGVAQLKIREMRRYPEYEHWVGGVYVHPEHRGRNVATQLVQNIIQIARQHSIHKLYLQAERLDGGLYSALGWEAMEQINDCGMRKLVMINRLA